MNWSKVYNWLDISQFLPISCCLCGQAGDQDYPLCRACEHDLPWLGHCCPRCAAPANTAGLVCGQCQNHPPPVDQTQALFHYQPPISQLVQQFKFNHRLALTQLFSQLLINRIEQSGETLPQAIIPVPLHPRRQRERGFNQAIEIARPIATAFNIPLLTDSCIRQHNTRTQSELNAKERKKNLSGAFTLQRDIHYQHIAIVDDVITTGTTVNELARALRCNGVQQVDCWAIARTHR